MNAFGGRHDEDHNLLLHRNGKLSLDGAAMAEEIGDTELSPHARDERSGVGKPERDAVGLVFPGAHVGRAGPRAAISERSWTRTRRYYYFAVAVNAGQVSRTLVQLRSFMRSHGITLSAGFDIVLPSNYIPWGGPGPAEKLEGMHRDAREKLKRVSPIIAKRDTGPIEKGPLWQRIIFTALYKMTFNMVPKMDKDFWVDDKCNGCGICGEGMPGREHHASNRDKPVWQHRCEQCLACIQWCPREAIQYGKKTPAYERYHHPEVKLKDMTGAGRA